MSRACPRAAARAARGAKPSRMQLPPRWSAAAYGRRMAPPPEGAETRAGFVALIGAPNAGKSTLINRLVGTKVSIVSHKVQTTRSIVRGIAISGVAQIVFVDTPGIFR